MCKYTIRTAYGLIAWYMRACKFDGWASFWRTIYVLPGHEHDQRLLRHERKHLEQIEGMERTDVLSKSPAVRQIRPSTASRSKFISRSAAVSSTS